MHSLGNGSDLPLPDNLVAERLTLGAILTTKDGFSKCANLGLTADQFALEKHGLIFLSMSAVVEQHKGDEEFLPDYVAVAEELERRGQLQAVDGLGYLISLDDNLPRLHNLAAYVEIIQRHATARRMVRLGETYKQDIVLGGDPLEIAQRAAAEFRSLSISKSGNSGLMSIKQIVDKEGGVNGFLDPERAAKLGTKTGFGSLDKKTGGFQPKDLVIVAGRPAMGKTAFALCCAENIAAPGNPQLKPGIVPIFSYEMSQAALLMRLVCSRARINHLRYRNNYLTPQERNALNGALGDLADAPIFIHAGAGKTILDVRRACFELAEKQGDLAMPIIDYMQLMPVLGQFDNRTLQVGSLSRGGKLLADELNRPVMMLSQLSRAPETRPGDHRPSLSDLRESGSIENDADIVAFVYREEVYRPDKESLKGLAEVIIGKQRNGPTCTVKLAFLGSCTRFENLATDMGDDPGEGPEPDDRRESAQAALGGGMR